MNSQKINVMKLDDKKQFAEQLESLITDSLNKMRNKHLLVINRKTRDGFYSIFRDAFYEYEKGVILLERFFKKHKCDKKGQSMKTFSDNDKAFMAEFNLFSKNIPNVTELTEEDMNQYKEKVNTYLEKINKMEPQVLDYDYFSYKNNTLMEFDELDDNYIKTTSELFTGLSIYIITTLTWMPMSEIPIGVTTIEYEDYVDMVITPILLKNGEN